MKRGIEGPPFRTDAAAVRALRHAVLHQKADGYTIISSYGRPQFREPVVVRIKWTYASDAEGRGKNLRIAAHRALCSAGLR